MEDKIKQPDWPYHPLEYFHLGPVKSMTKVGELIEVLSSENEIFYFSGYVAFRIPANSNRVYVTIGRKTTFDVLLTDITLEGSAVTDLADFNAKLAVAFP